MVKLSRFLDSGRVSAVVTTVAGIGAAGLAAVGAEPWLGAQGLALLFVPPVIIVAIRHGFAWAAIAAFISTAAVNYLFVEPRHTFVVGRVQDAVALAIFALVAALSSALAAQARAARGAAELRASQAALLRDQALTLASANSLDDVARACLVALSPLSDGAAVVAATPGRVWGETLCDEARDAALFAMSTKRHFAPSPDAPYDTAWRFWPVIADGEPLLALGLKGPIPLGADDTAGQMASVAGLAVSRLAASQRAESARIDVARERLKSDLLAGVSHDLRTPLSTILFTLQSLQRFAGAHGEAARADLVALAEGEARRLSAMVEALLDARRVGVGGVPVRVEPVAAVELMRLVRDALPAEHAPDKFDTAFDDGLPLIRADTDLAVRALTNVVANGVRHGGGHISVTARLVVNFVYIDIRDKGPGLESDVHLLFKPFHRGRADDGRPPGLGLGLALARSFMRAQGGDLTARNAEGGGAIFTASFQVDTGMQGNAR